MKVKSLTLKKFHNNEWLGFLEHLLDQILIGSSINSSEPVISLKYLYDEYKRMLSLDCQVDGMMVAEADRAADQAWSCLNAQLKIALVHPDISLRSAASRIYPILSKYGNPTRLTYDQEYAKLKLLLQDLSNASQDDLKITHADVWFEELQSRYTYFMDIYNKRVGHSASVDPGAVKLARQTSESAYKSLVAFLDSSVKFSNDDRFEHIISELNDYIDTQKASFKQRTSQPNTQNRFIEMPETIEDMEMDEDELAGIV